MSLASSRGSALIETLASTSVLIAVVSGGLMLAYVSFAHVWLDRAGYEALICLSTVAPEATCRANLLAFKERALPVGKVQRLSMSRSARSARIEFRFAIHDQSLFRIQNSVKLPLHKDRSLK